MQSNRNSIPRQIWRVSSFLMLFLIIPAIFLTKVRHWAAQPDPTSYEIGDCLQKELVESWEYDIVWIVLEVGKQSYLLAPFSSALSGEDRITIKFNNTEYKKIPCNP
ncbi:MAG: hypothetical protein HC836_49755 [Richelia sp. RM2_1_2]|nr:hypothetical protein [Richelia sp. RM2_1_2]